MNQGYNYNHTSSEMPGDNMQASLQDNENPVVETLPNGVKILKDGSQILANGDKILPDGTIESQDKVDNPVVNVLENGTQVLKDNTQILPDGTKILPDGTTIFVNGDKILPDGTRVINTDNNETNGQKKCPNCGSTEVRIKPEKGVLVCEFCRHEFVPEKFDGMVDDLSQLQGQIIGSGASDIKADTKDMITIKCGSCGAEVVIDTAESTNARCHWCRNTLSLNQQVPNGAVPDVVLPFAMKKEVARAKIEHFVGKRKFFAHPIFTKEFTTENIMGVYFPYMVVDVNAHSNLVGEGEHQTRKYTIKSGDHYNTYYDADLFHVERDFDIIINGLTVESNSDRLNNQSKDKTNNIINSIMPFDIENCVKYDSHFLKGYTSEKRDTNVKDLKGLVDSQSKDIARFAANDTLQYYDRGVAWSKEQIVVKGQQWKAAYLPVWLYSYQQVSGNKKLLHYVAVNARTGETMGSVPIHMPKLLIVSGIVELLGILSMLWIDFDNNWIFLLVGFVFFIIMYARYRNSGARHHHETETKRAISNVQSVDTFIKHERGLSNSAIKGCNNKSVSSKTSNGGGITNSILKAAHINTEAFSKSENVDVNKNNQQKK